MKNYILTIKNAAKHALLLLLFAHSCQAQNIWIGGFAAQPNNWNMPANWSLHHVPDEFDVVIIPNTETTTRIYPTINNDVGTINQLQLGYNAYINIINQGKLTVEVVFTNNNIVIYDTVIQKIKLNQQIIDGLATESYGKVAKE